VLNRQQLLQELIDVQKYWIMLCQLWDYTPEELEAAYWVKSAAVRQRYTELWLSRLDRTMVILDLDNVLADFTLGFSNYLSTQWAGVVTPAKMETAWHAFQWYDAKSLDLAPQTWAIIKHTFRSSGGFGTLPVIPGARALIDALHAAGAVVVALTSRPIDRYPNIYAETVHWLNTHHLDVDHVWWGVDKAERLALANEAYHGFMANVWFAVDDDQKFVKQFSDLGIRTYWLAAKEPVDMAFLPDRVRWAPTLDAIRRDALGQETV